MLCGVALRCGVLCCVALCGGGVWPPSWWGVLRWCVAPRMVGRAVLGCSVVMCGLVCCGGVWPPHGGACCVGVWPPSWWGVCWRAVWCCVALSVVVLCRPPHGGACCVGVLCGVVWCCVLWWCVAPSWWGMLHWCVAPLIVGPGVFCCVALRRGVLCFVVLCGVVVVCGPSHGGACCVGVLPPAWWDMLRWGAVCCAMWRCVSLWCVAPLLVGRAALMCGPPHGGAVLRCVVLCRVGVRCVVLCGVVLCVVLVCAPPHGGACCVGVWPPSCWGVLRWGAVCCVVWRCLVCGGVWPPVWLGVLRWCVAPLMVGLCCIVLCCLALGRGVLCCVALCCLWCCCVAPLEVGRAAFVFGPPHGGAFCVGVRCVVLCGVVLFVVLVCGPPRAGACCGGLWPPPWWGVLRWGAVCCVVWRCVVCSGVWPPVCWGVLRWCVAPLMVGRVSVMCDPPRSGAVLCCVLLCRVTLRCVVLCCVVWGCVAPLVVGRGAPVCGLPHGGAWWVGVRCVALCGVVLCVVVVCGPPRGGACCVGVWPLSCWGVLRWSAVCCVVWCCVVCGAGVWPPSWWGVLRWCVAPLLVGRAALGCGVLCCVALCCLWWCVAPRMLGRAALGCGPPHGGACCGCVWPPPCWGVLCRCVWVLVHGALAGSMLGLFCWFAVVSATLRPALSGVGCLWCLPGRDGWAGLPSACGAPPLCPGQDGRAGLPSACGAPPRVFVSRVSSPCRSCSPACPPLTCVCAAPDHAAIWRRQLLRPPPPYPTPPLCLLSSAPPLLLCVAAPAGGCCPPPPPGFLFCGSWRLGPRFPLSPLCLVVVLRRLAVCWRLLLTPPPDLCFAAVVALPLAFLCSPSAFAPLGRLPPPPPVLCFGVLLLLPCAGWCWCAVLACSVLCGLVLLLAVW